MIYLKLEQKPKTLEELFTQLFSYYNASQLKSCETFEDESCNLSECDANKYRSIDDVLDIAQTYFPDLSEQHVIRSLLTTILEYRGDLYYPYLIACSKISRPTICFNEGEYPRVNIRYDFDSENLKQSRFKNWKEVCAIAGINSIKELQDIHN